MRGAIRYNACHAGVSRFYPTLRNQCPVFNSQDKQGALHFINAPYWNYVMPRSMTTIFIDTSNCPIFDY